MIFKFFSFTFCIMLLFDEVRFRDAELSRICKSDYRIRIHRELTKAVAKGKLAGKD